MLLLSSSNWWSIVVALVLVCGVAFFKVLESSDQSSPASTRAMTLFRKLSATGVSTR